MKYMNVDMPEYTISELDEDAENFYVILRYYDSADGSQLDTIKKIKLVLPKQEWLSILPNVPEGAVIPKMVISAKMV